MLHLWVPWDREEAKVQMSIGSQLRDEGLGTGICSGSPGPLALPQPLYSGALVPLCEEGREVRHALRSQQALVTTPTEPRTAEN